MEQKLSVATRRCLVEALYGIGMSIPEITKLLGAEVQCIRNDVYRHFGARKFSRRPTNTPDVYLAALELYTNLPTRKLAKIIHDMGYNARHAAEKQAYHALINALEKWLQIERLSRAASSVHWKQKNAETPVEIPW